METKIQKSVYKRLKLQIKDPQKLEKVYQKLTNEGEKSKNNPS